MTAARLTSRSAARPDNGVRCQEMQRGSSRLRVRGRGGGKPPINRKDEAMHSEIFDVPAQNYDSQKQKEAVVRRLSGEVQQGLLDVREGSRADGFRDRPAEPRRHGCKLKIGSAFSWLASTALFGGTTINWRTTTMGANASRSSSSVHRLLWKACAGTCDARCPRKQASHLRRSWSRTMGNPDQHYAVVPVLVPAERQTPQHSCSE
jgi:hypothetical protein